MLALAAGLGTARQVAALQRRVLTRFAGIKIDALPRPEPGRGRLARLTQRLTDRTAWRAVAYLVVRLPLTAVQAYVLVLVASAVADLLYPVGWLVLQANRTASRCQSSPSSPSAASRSEPGRGRSWRA